MTGPGRRVTSTFITANIYPSGPDRIKCNRAMIDTNVIQRSDTQRRSIADRRERGRAGDYGSAWSFHYQRTVSPVVLLTSWPVGIPHLETDAALTKLKLDFQSWFVHKDAITDAFSEARRRIRHILENVLTCSSISWCWGVITRTSNRTGYRSCDKRGHIGFWWFGSTHLL